MEKTEPKTAQLGGTSMEITRVGFGAWALGDGGNPAVDCAIVGFRRPDQVDPIVGAANQRGRVLCRGTHSACTRRVASGGPPRR